MDVEPGFDERIRGDQETWRTKHKQREKRKHFNISRCSDVSTDFIITVMLDLWNYVSVCLSVCLHVCLSSCLSSCVNGVCLYVCLSLSLSVTHTHTFLGSCHVTGFHDRCHKRSKVISIMLEAVCEWVSPLSDRVVWVTAAGSDD